MNRQEFEILAELGDIVSQLEQRLGDGPGRGIASSSVIERQIAAFAHKCECGELKGRARKRKANQLFVTTLRALGDVM